MKRRRTGFWAIAVAMTLTACAMRPARPQPYAPVAVLPGHERARVLKLPYLLAERTTDYYHASESQVLNIELAARRLNGTVVPPGGVFNYYRTVGPYTRAHGYGWGRAFVGGRIVPSIGGGVCQGASTLYATVLRTDLVVLERHPHGLTVPYLPPGEDATVAGTVLNFRFKNPRTTPILIAATAGNRHLRVAVWGQSPGPKVTVHHRILARIPFATIVERDPRLPPGTEQVVAPGQDGVTAETWLDILRPGGVVRKDLGIDRYRPSPRIIRRGPPGPAKTPPGVVFGG